MNSTYVRWLGILITIAWACLKTPTAQADPAGDFFARLGEQQAAFEAFQVNRRFFLCNAEAANANLFPEGEAAMLAESATCVRSLLTKDAVFDNDGRIITGADSIVATVIGLLADVRQNVAFTLEPPLVLSFDAGRRPGTGAIRISLAIDLTHEITAPGPFGNILGGQVAKFRTEVTLRAVRPQQWLISSFVVRSLSFDSGLQLRFPTPLPRFPQRFPDQRGVG
jgi:hypothetical protein